MAVTVALDRGSSEDTSGRHGHTLETSIAAGVAMQVRGRAPDDSA
jgi:hypothetical protein